MGKAKKQKDKVGFFDFNNMKIQQRLKNSNTLILSIATIAAVVNAFTPNGSKGLKTTFVQCL